LQDSIGLLTFTPFLLLFFIFFGSKAREGSVGISLERFQLGLARVGSEDFANPMNIKIKKLIIKSIILKKSKIMLC
jgi:hypothetical protein